MNHSTQSKDTRQGLIERFSEYVDHYQQFLTSHGILIQPTGVPLLREALAALKQEDSERWLPIESAPKDEAILLLVPVPDCDPCVGEGCWTKGYEGSSEEPDCPASWILIYGWNMVNPSHWMPLPKPPAMSAATERGQT